MTQQFRYLSFLALWLIGLTAASLPRVFSQNALLRLNCGGPALVVDGLSFAKDQYFTGRSTQAYEYDNISAIEGTTLDALYRTVRTNISADSSFGYEVPLSNGEYQLNLHFAELFFGVAGRPGEAGQRVFSVTVEGETVLPDLDLYAEVGPQTALVKQFSVEVEDGALTIDFDPIASRPQLVALEIFGNGILHPPASYQPGGCVWARVEDALDNRFEANSVRMGQKMFVFSGFGPGAKVREETEMYDIETDTWVRTAPMPIPLTHNGVAKVGEEIWSLGGFVGDHPGKATDVVQIYHTRNDTWRMGPPLPSPRGSGASVFNQGRIHYFGGLRPDRQTDIAQHIVYDPSQPELGWQELKPLPNPRNHLSAVSIDGKIYAIGGQTGHDGAVQDRAFLHRYDPDTDTWTRLADLPRQRSHFEPGTEVHEGTIIIVGGRDGDFFFDEVTRYDPVTNTWEQLCTLEDPLLAPAAKVFGNKLYVAKGSINGTSQPQRFTRWIYLPAIQRPDPKLRPPVLPLARSARPRAAADRFLEVGVYPNPARSWAQVSFEIPDVSQVALQVSDLQGRLLLSRQAQRLPAGRHSWELDLSGLPPGMLFYQLQVDGKIRRGRLLKAE